MTQPLIILLRAVNVGGRGTLAMAQLRALAESCGLQHVRSYIQSGNLVCTSSAPTQSLRRTLEARLAADMGQPVGVVIRTGPEMAQILAANPFTQADPARIGVLFLNAPSPQQELVQVPSQIQGQRDEEIRPGPGVLFVHYPSGMGRSKLRLPAMATGTQRNLKTVAKLAAMAAQPG